MSNSISLEQLKHAAINLMKKWDRIYDECVLRQNAAVAEVKTANRTLPDHFWQEGHNARIRREASKLLLEIIKEIDMEQKALEENGKES